MRRLIAVILLLVAAPVAAQDRTCNNGLPCGPIPWALPVFPMLISPTPMPSAVATATPTVTYTPSPTNMPTATATSTPTLNPSVSPTLTPTLTASATATTAATATPLLDTSGIEEALATIQGFSDATAISVGLDGTPTNLTDQMTVLGGNAGEVFGYIRGLKDANIVGKATPMLTFTFIVLLVVIAVKLLTFMGPIIAVLVGIIRRLVSLVLDFLPL